MCEPFVSTQEMASPPNWKLDETVYICSKRRCFLRSKKIMPFCIAYIFRKWILKFLSNSNPRMKMEIIGWTFEGVWRFLLWKTFKSLIKQIQTRLSYSLGKVRLLTAFDSVNKQRDISSIFFLFFAVWISGVGPLSFRFQGAPDMLSSIRNSIGAVQLLIYHASPKFGTCSQLLI